MSNQILSVKPIINYPSLAQIGQTYLMTIDLQPEEDSDWQLEEEEYPVYCSVSSEAFESRAIGEPIITMHCFGGSYGAKSFLLKANKIGQAEDILITFRNKWGAPIKSIELKKIRVISKVIKDQDRILLENSFFDDSNYSDESSNHAIDYISDIFIEFGLTNTVTAVEGLRDQVYQASQKFIGIYIRRHGFVKILSMETPVSIHNIYTTVNILDDSNLSFSSVSELERAYRQSQSRRFSTRIDARKSGFEIANEFQFLTILGGPGTGKSTLLRQIGIKAIQGDNKVYNHEQIPILIELKRLSESPINLLNEITREFEVAGFPKIEEALVNLLKAGKLLILLDGLDEVPIRNLDEIIKNIQDFVEVYDKNRFIISCRTAAYQSSFNRFTDVAIASFDDEQISQFIENWFTSSPNEKTTKAKDLWRLLQQPKSLSIKELANSPLLLTFICLVYGHTNDFPINRSRLYQRAIFILLEEWAAQKRVHGDPIYEGLYSDLELYMLSKIAYTNFKDDKLFFARQEIVTQIQEFLTDTLNAPKFIDGSAVLRAIEIQQGFLVERAVNVYSFSHLTLQEYLAAKHIIDNVLIEQMIESHIDDQRWREIFFIISELLSTPAAINKLLLNTEKKILSYGYSEKLKTLLNWAEHITSNVEGDYMSSARRVIAIFVVLCIDRVQKLQLIQQSQSIPENAEDIEIANQVFKLAKRLGLSLNLSSLDSSVFLHSLNLQNSIVFLSDFATAIEEASIFNIDIDLASLGNTLTALKEQESRIYQQDDSLLRSLVRQALDNWFETISLERNLINLSTEDYTALKHLIYMNSLMLDMKTSAEFANQSDWPEIEQLGWTEIEKRIFTGNLS
ncbi:NACHT domain-containing protein [Leptothoe spongobia TAU-MAC 1115]|uniref:NACHT domain-containing protein n=1 Tax=Leptothoe spongobia TAU-MAC 1115 TaxID=1967444 RepID=A0A947DHH8_9CYAN|nr:NACHT domain-containing protein [Leptothoe spongobia TAU-MAC 1115]